MASSTTNAPIRSSIARLAISSPARRTIPWEITIGSPTRIPRPVTASRSAAPTSSAVSALGACIFASDKVKTYHGAAFRRSQYFVDGGVIVVNGFFPSLTPKQVVVAAASALASESAATPTFGEKTPTETLLAQIQRATRGPPSCAPKRLYIVLHNIDGPQLRTSEAQALLGELASMERVHLIASIDHVNSPLLWSKREAARFNWVWQEAATFTPYALETANVPQLLASKGEARHVRGAANVLRSLTSNGRAIFRLLAEHQLENQDSHGMPLDMFYASCREQFLVSSEITLRVHLTELTDHELAQSKRGADGRDLLSVPLHADALKELLASFEPRF